MEVEEQQAGGQRILFDFQVPPQVLAAVRGASEEGMEWVVYNPSYRVMDIEDLFFFCDRNEAVQFAEMHSNGIDYLTFRRFDSVEDFLYKISQTREPGFLIKQKTNSMNNENAEFLQNQIKYAGFGEELNGALVKALKADEGEFTLNHSHKFGKDDVDSALHFKRSKESDMYFFNSYDVAMKKEAGKDITNTFYINQGQSITLKEAYNLLNGRAVEKELTRKLSPEETLQYKAEMKLPREQRGLPENWEKAPTYQAWIKLDMNHRDKNGNFEMKQYHENFGFKLEDVLAKLPLRKMDASTTDDLLGSLKKGNVAQVSFNVDGNDKKMFLAADPQFKAITVYDANMNLARKETYSQNTKKDLATGPEAPWEEKKTDVKNEKAVSKSDLLPKNKKGNGLIDKKQKEGEGKKMKVA